MLGMSTACDAEAEPPPKLIIYSPLSQTILIGLLAI